MNPFMLNAPTATGGGFGWGGPSPQMPQMSMGGGRNPFAQYGTDLFSGGPGFMGGYQQPQMPSYGSYGGGAFSGMQMQRQAPQMGGFGGSSMGMPQRTQQGFSGLPGSNAGMRPQQGPQQGMGRGGIYAQIVDGGIMGAPDHDSSFSDWFAPRGSMVKSPVNGTVVSSGRGFFGQVGLAIRGDDGGMWEMRHGDGMAQPGMRVQAGQPVFRIGDDSLPAGWQHVDIRLNGRGATQFLRQNGAQAQSMPTGGPSQGMGFLSQPGPLAGQGGGQYGGFGGMMGGGMNPFSGMMGGNPFGMGGFGGFPGMGGPGGMGMGGMPGPMGMPPMMPPMMGMPGMGMPPMMGMGMPPMMGMNPFMMRGGPFGMM